MEIHVEIEAVSDANCSLNGFRVANKAPLIIGFTSVLCRQIGCSGQADLDKLIARQAECKRVGEKQEQPTVLNKQGSRDEETIVDGEQTDGGCQHRWRPRTVASELVPVCAYLRWISGIIH